jgi:hypothetical protein
VAATKPLRRSELDIGEIHGETVVYDLRTADLHYLNHPATVVFGLCDGQATMKEMASAIGEAFEMPASEVEPQVRGIVRQLRKKNLLEPTQARVEHAAKPRDHDLDERDRIRIEVPRSD